MKHLTEDDLILLYYNEPGLSPMLRTHLTECPECRSASEVLGRTLDACSEWTVPFKEDSYGRTVWAQLAPKLTPTRSSQRDWLASLLLPRAWIAAAAVAVLLVAAFVAGRISQHPSAPITAGLSPQARERILQISLADHLDRTEVLLTEIANATGPDAGDFASDRERAHDLLSEARLLRQSLEARGDRGTAAILDEVERVMLEIANAPEHVEAQHLEDLQRRIKADSLLFKVRIIESNLRTQGRKL
jgi:hypothetical protein